MWSFFSRDPAKDFAYEVGEKVNGLEDKSIWSLHEGKHKVTGNIVSVFTYDIKASSETQTQLAKASLKKIKTLRHPNILTFLDGLESEKLLYIVTEPVTPLETYLKNNEQYVKQNELAISWGLHQITKGLSFLVNDCGFIHNNVCLSSVFVDLAGEWKLGGVDYMYPATGPQSIPLVKILPALEKYDPPEKTDPHGGRKPTEKWSADMWGLGVLIWEVFNGSLPRTTSLKTLGKIPKSLVPNYCELVGANPRSRPNPSKFIESCRASNGFMDNQFIKTMLFLEEIQIKEQNEKIAFFNSLPPVLDSFPQAFCKHKILPQLVHAFEFGNAGSSVLAPLFKLGKLLDSAEYQTKIVPCVVKLFSSPDRATRVKLLQQMEYFVEHLQPTVVNEKVFPHVVQGFMDTNPLVRECTIKSMLHLAPKLSYKNIHDDLLKHFARLQTKDDQGGIRTNTTVCLGKIACYINPQIRPKVLSSAYLRSVKDPFPPARQAGILAMTATHQFFTLQESSVRLLPTLCTLTMDTDKGVRDQAFKAIKCFLGKLEKYSENPELLAEMEKDVNSGSSSASYIAASWAGWAVSGAVSGVTSLTSKIYKGKEKQGPSPTSTPASKPDSAAKPAASVPSPVTAVTPQATAPADEGDEDPTDTQPDSNPYASGWENNDWEDNEDWGTMEDFEPDAGASDRADTWDDGWNSIEDSAPPAEESGSSSGGAAVKVSPDPSPWGHSDFAPVKDATVSSTSAYNWGDPDDNSFFTAMIEKDKKKQKPSPFTTSHKTSTAKSLASKPTSSVAKTNTSSVSKTSSASQPGLSVTPSGGDGWTESGWDDSSGWDDGEDQWQSPGDDPGISKAEAARRKREERKAQRQKELEEKRAARSTGGGALKLGAKKLTKD